MASSVMFIGSIFCGYTGGGWARVSGEGLAAPLRANRRALEVIYSVSSTAAYPFFPDGKIPWM